MFFSLFLQPDVYVGADLLSECIAQGAQRMLPAVHASSHAPSAGFGLSAAGLARGFASGNAEGMDGEPGGGAEEGFDAASFTGDEQTGSGKAPKGAVRKTYSAAVAGARSLLMTTSLQGGMELRHAKRVVQPLVD